MLRNCGDIILVKGLLTRNSEGKIIYDERSSYKGRPCVIISDTDHMYHVCPLVNAESFSFEKIFFDLNKNMMNISDLGVVFSNDNVNMSKFISLSIYDDFECIGRITPKNYLRLLQEIIKLYNNYEEVLITDQKAEVLNDIELQLHTLSRSQK